MKSLRAEEDREWKGRKRGDGVEGKTRNAAPRDVFPGTSSPKPRRSLRPSKGAGFVKESGLAAGDFRRRAVTAEGCRGWAIFARERDRREGT